MTEQTSLLDAPVDPTPRAMIEYLTGLAGRHAFGEKKRTVAEERLARDAAEAMGAVLAELRDRARS